MSEKNKYILIFGANGMLGRYMASYFDLIPEFKVIRIMRNQIDAQYVTNEKLKAFLDNYKNAYVINCIGKIPQRGNEDIRSYIQINSIFPYILSNCCTITQNKLIHITTDCVYTGKKGRYTEIDEHDEKNIYGLSKSLGEPNDVCIIRTSIIGEEIENKKSLLEWVKNNQNKHIDGFVNHYWNGVTCLQLCKIVHKMIIDNIFWKGVRHIYSPNTLSKYDMVKCISNIYQLNILINPKETIKIDKSLSSINDIIFEIPSIENQIIQLKEFSSNLV